MESTNIEDLDRFTVNQLKEELKIRYLPLTGNKADLVDRLHKDNVIKIENGILEDYKRERTKRMSEQMELKNLQLQLQQLKQDEVNQPSTSGTSNYDQTLLQILQTQSIILQQMANPVQSKIQVFSTTDTSQAIPLFGGNKTENASEWVKQVERIGGLANWSENLMLVNAAMRLRGPANDWNRAVGKGIIDWHEWKDKLCERFSVKMSFAEFITYQAKRMLRNTETITEYIYSKNAIFTKSPCLIPEVDKVSLILEGIYDTRWSIPLATHCCTNVEELLSHATALDNIRKVIPKEKYYRTEAVSTSSAHNNNVEQQKFNKYIPKFNPSTDKKDEQICYRCRTKGHVSYDCKLQGNPTTLNGNSNSKLNTKPAEQNFVKQQPSTSTGFNNNKTTFHKQVGCIQNDSPNITLIPVIINGSLKCNALPDSGSVITIIDKNVLPQDTQVYPWDKGNYKVAGNILTPIGWLSARIQVGKIDYVMPQIAVCDNLPVPMIIGKDWQYAVYARIIHEPDGKICIVTPTHTEYFPSTTKECASIACCINNNIAVKEICHENKNKVMKLVSEYEDIFKNNENDIGKFPDFELEINLKHDKPISCKPYRLPEPERLFLKQTVEKWLDQKICRMSNSPYAAPMFVVEQPFHDTTPYRPVVDYSRTINPVTILDAQPIERMDDIITTISQFAYKFKLDIYHAYHNICIREQDIFKTAVVTQDYHVEFMRVMFGLVGGPSIMSKVIKSTYGSLYDKGVRAYFDDITGGSSDIEDFIQILKQVFDLTRQKKLKLNKEKCIFIDTEIPLFGKIIGHKEEKTDPKRTAAVDHYKTLSTITEIRSFLGFTGTFRKFIQNYALIAQPLQALLKKDKFETHSVNQKQDRIKNKQVTLSEEQQNAFLTLKKLVTTAPVLSNFQQNAETIVETDSSYQGMGACLFQIQNGEKKVIEYASRCLKDTETRYHINELEVTAVHWAIVNKFRIYLLGTEFKLITDSYSTAYIINKAKLNRKFARYVIDLAPFNFTPLHRPGIHNTVADHLSRYPLNEVCLMIVSSNSEKLKLAQDKDQFIQQVKAKLAKEKTTQHLRQIQESFLLEEGILLHINKEEIMNNKKIVVPQSLRTSLIKIAHDDNGHLDFSTTMTKIRSKYWWRTLRKDVKAYTSACITCAKVNRRTKLTYGKMGQRPIPNTPMQVISSDHIVALPPTSSGNIYIFVHIDHATRYIFAKPTCTLSAQSVIDTIENDLIHVYGPPLTYISDGAPCFTSQLTQNFFSKYGIEHIPTTPYTAQSNGLVERANAYIISTLTKFALNNNTDWDKLLPKAILAINISKQKTTGHSPFYLMFGYHPRIPPNEIHFGTILEDIDRAHQLEFLTNARKTALQNINNVHEYNKKNFDLRRLQHNITDGSYVLYEWYKPTDNKLTPRYKGPFKVIRRVGSVCYEIQDVQKPEKKKIVHVQFLKILNNPHNLDLISDLILCDNTIQNSIPNDDQGDDSTSDDYTCPDQNDDDDDQKDDSTSNIQTCHNHVDDQGNDTIPGQYKRFVTSRGRVTNVPNSWTNCFD